MITFEELKEAYIRQDGLCALTGIKMTYGIGRTGTSMSLDRIEQEKGYISGNVRIICDAINMFRGMGSDDEMLRLAKLLLMNYPYDRKGAKG